MNLVVTNQGVISENEYFKDILNAEESIYEVIRIISGVAIFLEDHFYRLQNSMEIKRTRFDMTLADFRCHINELIGINKKQEGNIKFVCSVAEENSNWALSFIPASYPDIQDYKNGVSVDFLKAERENPNAKVIQNLIRESANRMIENLKLYEILLVDNDGLITEGSRSNVFFVKEEMFYTAPTNKVLVGITRQKVFDCLSRLNFQIIEQAVSVKEIGSFDAVFITGTSPKILPVRFIGNHLFSTQNATVKQLMREYNQMIQDYVQTKKGSSPEPF